MKRLERHGTKQIAPTQDLGDILVGPLDQVRRRGRHVAHPRNDATGRREPEALHHVHRARTDEQNSIYRLLSLEALALVYGFDVALVAHPQELPHQPEVVLACVRLGLHHHHEVAHVLIRAVCRRTW
jgi:hypothetical protein